jgi:hypothetical protein
MRHNPITIKKRVVVSRIILLCFSSRSSRMIKVVLTYRSVNRSLKLPLSLVCRPIAVVINYNTTRTIVTTVKVTLIESERPLFVIRSRNSAHILKVCKFFAVVLGPRYIFGVSNRINSLIIDEGFETSRARYTLTACWVSAFITGMSLSKVYL